ncbi:hypothetical protein AcW1_010024 [Taiwanofungus camphoratus]|nr:hypothetical protein AcV7_005368 [Antrodia cinnamomea]KAI0946595.1 hypothetical protein AcW1_010024 [Antrodia cinnamomea]
MAPELFDPGRFGIKGPPQPRKASDMYSLSMLMWEIFTGRYPLHEYFTDSLIRDAVLSEKRPQRPPHTTAFGLSDVVWGIMAACWTHDPFQRPKVNDISSRLYDAYVDYAPESVSEEEMKKAIHLFGKDGTEADISMVSTTITI